MNPQSFQNLIHPDAGRIAQLLTLHPPALSNIPFPTTSLNIFANHYHHLSSSKMDSSKYALPLGSRILVTGANGYISTHVVDQLLGLGYSVRGTLRTEKPWLNEYFLNKYGKGRFETVVISLQNKDEVDRALDGVDGLIHLVLSTSYSMPNHWHCYSMLIH